MTYLIIAGNSYKTKVLISLEKRLVTLLTPSNPRSPDLPISRSLDLPISRLANKLGTIAHLLNSGVFQMPHYRAWVRTSLQVMLSVGKMTNVRGCEMSLNGVAG